MRSTLSTLHVHTRLGLALAALILGFAPPARADEAPQAAQATQSPPAAQYQAALRLAVVDMEETLRGSKAGQALLAELEAMVKEKRAAMQALEREAKDIRAQAVSMAGAGNERTLADLQRQFNEKSVEMRRFQDEANQEIGKKRVALLSQFNRLVMPLIQALGRERGETMIFRKDESGLLFVDPGVDLTRQVIQRLDALS